MAAGKKNIFTIVLLFIVLSITAQNTNMVKNPGFEDGQDTLPDYWTVALWDRKVETTEIRWQNDNAHSGQKCMLINSIRPNDARIIQAIQVEKNKTYKFSCWIKTENVGKDTLGASISVVGYPDTAGDFRGTNDYWQETAVYLRIEKNITFLEIGLGIGGYASLNTGKAFFDDIVVQEITGAPDTRYKTITVKEEISASQEITTKRVDNTRKTGIEVYLMLIFFTFIFTLVILFSLLRANPILLQKLLAHIQKKHPVKIPETATNVEVDAGSEVEVDAGSEVEVEAGSEVEVEAGSEVEIEAGNEDETEVEIETKAEVFFPAVNDQEEDTEQPAEEINNTNGKK